MRDIYGNTIAIFYPETLETESARIEKTREEKSKQADRQAWSNERVPKALKNKVSRKYEKPVTQDIFGAQKYDDTDFNYTDFIDYIDMNSTSKQELLSIRNVDLEKICMNIGVKKSGKKSQKIASIMEGLSDILKNVIWTTPINIPSGDDAMQYVFENGLHEIPTFYAVRTMAYRPIKVWQDEKTGEVKQLPYDCAGGCMILMNNLHDPLWDDARQSVAMAIIENPEIMHVEDGFCRLTKEGYHIVKKSISRMFGKQRMNKSQTKDDSLETVVCSNGGEIEKIVKVGKKSNSAYIQALSYNVPDFEALANNDFIVSFFKWLKTSKYKKYYEPIFSVFCGKVEGMTNGQIMTKKGISRRIFDKSLGLLKSAYNDFGKVCYDSKIDSLPMYGTTTYISKAVTPGGNNHCEGISYRWSYPSKWDTGEIKEVAPSYDCDKAASEYKSSVQCFKDNKGNEYWFKDNRPAVKLSDGSIVLKEAL